MDAITCIKTRRSIRKFKSDKVSPEIIKDIVLTASYAPSWKNTQTTRYIAITDPEIKDRIPQRNAVGHTIRKLLMVHLCQQPQLLWDKRSGFERDGSYTTSREDNWQAFDNGVATQTFCLAAHEKGLGTVIMGMYDIDKAAEILDVPEGQLLMALIAIGYPDEDPAVPKKKTVEDLLKFSQVIH